MEKITPVITALPFFRLQDGWTLGSAVEPFYYQKNQCISDCNFGTITDKEHLPSFIIKVPINQEDSTLDVYNVNYTTEILMESICADGSSVETITPYYRWEVIAFIYIADLPYIVSDGPANGDKYWVEDHGSYYIYEWNGVGWTISAAAYPNNNDLINVSSEGFVYRYDSTSSSWKKTLFGLQICDIGSETYLIYNGFKVETLLCGLRHIRISFPNQPMGSGKVEYISELVDIREFDIDDNSFHKLKISNTCALGNIPYSDIDFSQIYYFHEKGRDAFVCQPDYETKENSEEDGLGNEKLIFKRINKVFQLDTLEIPEYIVDFLMFATQHNIVSITFPFESTNSFILSSQYKGEREVDADTFTGKNDWIDSACYATVNLRFSLVDDIIKTGCCQALDKNGCIVCSNVILRFVCWNDKDIIESTPPSKGDKFVIKAFGSVGCDVCDDPMLCNEWAENYEKIAEWNGSGWDYTAPTNDLCVTNTGVGEEGVYFYTPSDGWKIVNSLELVGTTVGTMSVKGFIYSDVSGYLYYRVSGTFNWILAGIYTQSQLEAGVTISSICEENYDLRLSALNNNCDYGYGDILEVGTPVCA